MGPQAQEAFCIVERGGVRLAVPVGDVCRVLGRRRVTPIPRAPAHIVGLVSDGARAGAGAASRPVADHSAGSIAHRPSLVVLRGTEPAPRRGRGPALRCRAAAPGRRRLGGCERPAWRRLDRRGLSARCGRHRAGPGSERAGRRRHRDRGRARPWRWTMGAEPSVNHPGSAGVWQRCTGSSSCRRPAGAAGAARPGRRRRAADHRASAPAGAGSARRRARRRRRCGGRAGRCGGRAARACRDRSVTARRARRRSARRRDRWRTTCAPTRRRRSRARAAARPADRLLRGAHRRPPVDAGRLLPSAARRSGCKSRYLAGAPAARDRRRLWRRARRLASGPRRVWRRAPSFSDLLLVRASDGRVVYSVAKTPLFQTSLLDGPYADYAAWGAGAPPALCDGAAAPRWVDFAPFAPGTRRADRVRRRAVVASGELAGLVIAALSPDGLSRAVSGGGALGRSRARERAAT